MLSWIFPVQNEMANPFFWKSIELLKELKNFPIQVIVISGLESEEQKNLCEEHGIEYYILENSNRAQRINFGIQKAKHDVILINHPRSVLSKDGIIYLLENKDSFKWGVFRHEFNIKHPLLNFTSFYSNYIRGSRGIYYLDHCFFWNKNIQEGPILIPEVDIFEDTELSKILLKYGKPKLLDFPSTTSAIRFEQNGVWNQAIKNQFLKLAYYFNIPHDKMNKWYEKGLGLNQKYK